MNKQGIVKVVLAMTLFSLVTTSGWASNKGGPGGQGGQGGPPPEAIAACKGKQVGDSVEFAGRRGDTVEATCQEKDGQMAAVPKNPPKSGQRQ